MKKQLADDKLLKELRDSAFFRGRVSPTSKKQSAPHIKTSPTLRQQQQPISQEKDIRQPTTSAVRVYAPQTSDTEKGERNKKRTSERSNLRTNERTKIDQNLREKIRHTFDIYADQLRAMQLLQLEAVRAGKRKPKLGDMVQEALDTFLKKQSQRKRTFERTNEPPDEQI